MTNGAYVSRCSICQHKYSQNNEKPGLNDSYMRIVSCILLENRFFHIFNDSVPVGLGISALLTQ